MFWDFEWLLKFTTKSPFFSFLFSLAGSTALFIAWISSELPEPIKNARKLQSNYSVNISGLWLFVWFFFRPTIGAKLAS